MDLQITRKQQRFIDATQDEVLFGGAAGGGKSYAQLIDALLFALKYQGSKQLLLRRTFPELNRSLILTSLTIYPTSIAKYNGSEKKWRFSGGSSIEFGYCDSDADVTNYQSAEYDCIRFDELTHFSEFQYTYLISRIRGVNNFPKQIKSSTNPGGLGHSWVKKRFIDASPPETSYQDDLGRSYIFIPSKVTENKFLMESDPGYIQRLQQLGEDDRKALLEGEWDIFAGQYFPEFSREVHVMRPHEEGIPDHWYLFRSMDYGLDMLSVGWWAVDLEGRLYRYREINYPHLTLTQAAKAVLEATPAHEEKRIAYTVASPDLWNRRQETGISGYETMTNAGLRGLTRADAHRINGWRALREYLDPYDREGVLQADIAIYDTCTYSISCLPQLIHDKHNVEDAAGEPHDITHAPEEIRYAVMSRPRKAKKPHAEKTPQAQHKANLAKKSKTRTPIR